MASDGMHTFLYVIYDASYMYIIQELFCVLTSRDLHVRESGHTKCSWPTGITSAILGLLDSWFNHPRRNAPLQLNLLFLVNRKVVASAIFLLDLLAFGFKPSNILPLATQNHQRPMTTMMTMMMSYTMNQAILHRIVDATVAVPSRCQLPMLPFIRRGC